MHYFATNAVSPLLGDLRSFTLDKQLFIEMPSIYTSQNSLKLNVTNTNSVTWNWNLFTYDILFQTYTIGFFYVFLFFAASLESLREKDSGCMLFYFELIKAK